jgi:hypothetical protein
MVVTLVAMSVASEGCWPAGFSLHPTDADSLYTLQRYIQDSPKFRRLRQFVAGESPFEEGNTESLFPMVRDLIEEVIMLADAVCATPFGLSQEPYARFNREEAKAIVLDDAGSMLQADALLVWGQGCRPCVMAGDPKESPTVPSYGEMRNGRVANMFSEFAKISQLVHVVRMGWPCFILNGQFGRGGFVARGAQRGGQRGGSRGY